MADSAEESVIAPPPPPPVDDAPEGAPDWIVTFADLATLLLCFFVLLLSFSSMDQQRFKEVAGSLKEAFGVQRMVPVFDMPRGIDLVARDFNTTFSADIAKRIRSAIKKVGGKAGEVKVEETARGLLIKLPGAILFGSGSVDLSVLGKDVLSAVLPIVSEVGGEVHLEGHSDATTFGGGSGALDGNWRLSFDRALAVLVFFSAEGGLLPETLIPIGRGASVPVASNATTEGRQANRRVEVLILKASSKSVGVDVAEGSPSSDVDSQSGRTAPGTAGADDGATATTGADGLASDMHIPEANFSPTEHVLEHGGGPVSLFPESY